MAWAVRRVLKSGEVRYLARYRDASGRCHSAGTAPTQKIALALAREQESRIFRGDWQDPALARTTLAEYFSVRWLPNRILELNTCKTYLAHWRTAIAPEFGNRAMRTITPGQVQEWVTRMQRQGASRVTIRDRFRVLQAILAAQHGVSAVRDGYLRSNPCAGVTLPHVPKREVTIYTPENMNAILDALDPWYAPMVEFMLETTCRWGEAQGLLVSDIWDRVVNIRHTIVEGTKADTGNGTPFAVKDYPKNTVPRRLKLSSGLSTLVDETISSRSLAPADRLFARRARRGGIARSPAWPNGIPVSRSTFLKAWRRACEDAGLPYQRPYDTRATGISWALAGGASTVDVMSRAGHAQLSTTQRYIQVLDGADERVLAAFQRVANRRPAERGGRLRPAND